LLDSLLQEIAESHDTSRRSSEKLAGQRQPGDLKIHHVPSQADLPCSSWSTAEIEKTQKYPKYQPWR